MQEAILVSCDMTIIKQNPHDCVLIIKVLIISLIFTYMFYSGQIG